MPLRAREGTRQHNTKTVEILHCLIVREDVRNSIAKVLTKTKSRTLRIYLALDIKIEAISTLDILDNAIREIKFLRMIRNNRVNI